MKSNIKFLEAPQIVQALEEEAMRYADYHGIVPLASTPDHSFNPTPAYDRPAFSWDTSFWIRPSQRVQFCSSRLMGVRSPVLGGRLLRRSTTSPCIGGDVPFAHMPEVVEVHASLLEIGE